MPTNTTNYGLVKQSPDEFYDVMVTNQNMDSIDSELKRIADNVAGGATQQDLADLEALIGNLSGLETDVKTSIVAAINSLKAIITAHLADYEYQTPTVIGTQIRLTKQSDTDRLFFKLGADLSGNITISTDNGATSKPLVDVDGSEVTQLEKGFVEVVASAAFFILRNRGISGADKQALINIINEAERNESDLKALFADAVNAVDTDGEINLPANATWADILAVVPSIKTGKKWAGGNTGALSSNPTVVISGLSFTPSFVIAQGGETKNYQWLVATNYNKSGFNIDSAIGSTPTTITQRTSIWSEDGVVIYPNLTTSAPNGFKWIAIE